MPCRLSGRAAGSPRSRQRHPVRAAGAALRMGVIGQLRHRNRDDTAAGHPGPRAQGGRATEWAFTRPALQGSLCSHIRPRVGSSRHPHTRGWHRWFARALARGHGPRRVSAAHTRFVYGGARWAPARRSTAHANTLGLCRRRGAMRAPSFQGCCRYLFRRMPCRCFWQEWCQGLGRHARVANTIQVWDASQIDETWDGRARAPRARRGPREARPPWCWFARSKPLGVRSSCASAMSRGAQRRSSKC